MDSDEVNEEDNMDKKNGDAGLRRTAARSVFGIVLTFFVFLLLSFSVMHLAVWVEKMTIWSPISLHSNCRIISSSVDLRSSKVCELGFINYKAKNVFYPFERRKYRCHYDYYWASVFKVEYMDHSGQAKFALAEAPNEALPDDCRPSFGRAWLTKDKFKVNGTYECWYTLGTAKVNINHEGLFNCRAEDPSTVEMIKRYSILFTRVLKSWLTSSWSVKQWRWDLVDGMLTDFVTSLLSITMLALLRPLISSITRLIRSWWHAWFPTTGLLKRACFFAVYFSFMSWWTVQFLKRLGLSYTY